MYNFTGLFSHKTDPNMFVTMKPNQAKIPILSPFAIVTSEVLMNHDNT